MTSRRDFLKWMFGSALGVGFLLAANSVVKLDSITHNETSIEATQQSIENGSTIGTDHSILSVRVVYLQMAQYFATREEYFILQTPATVQDLLVNVTEDHPQIAKMMSNMWILVNGSPAKLSHALNDGDEVDLVPLVAGG
ncbi:MAG TPA: MoaD/ThiS family protein [Terriglobales bacterium]|nr:MoaD/ThiS family protein [Terriglobales bacterium]